MKQMPCIQNRHYKKATKNGWMSSNFMCPEHIISEPHDLLSTIETRTDYKHTRPKLKHTVHTGRRKETNTHTGRETDKRRG